jgi:hypothetical protein
MLFTRGNISLPLDWLLGCRSLAAGFAWYCITPGFWFLDVASLDSQRRVHRTVQRLIGG